MDAGKAGTFLGSALWLMMLFLYIIGIVSLIRDDHRYTTKNLVAGVFIFPYAWYIGGKSIHHWTTTSPEQRQAEDRCLDYADGQGLTRKSRVFICECIAKGSTVQSCNSAYEKSYQADN